MDICLAYFAGILFHILIDFHKNFEFDTLQLLLVTSENCMICFLKSVITQVIIHVFAASRK